MTPPHELATRNIDLVDEVLRNFLRKNGWAEPYSDDLQGEGYLALLEAGVEWPGGSNFRGWARNRIVWAMMDEATLLGDVERPGEGSDRKRQPRVILNLDASVSIPGNTGEARPLSEVLPDPTNFPEHSLRDIQRGRLRDYLAEILTPSEYISMARVFGLSGQEPLSFTEAAEVEGVARQTLTERIYRTLDKIQEKIPELRVYLE